MVTLTQIIVFLGALDFVTLTDTNNSNVGSYETVAMSGVYFEEEESVDLYDGVGVLIYDIAKPSWLNQFPFFLGYPCQSDKYAEASLCPIFYYLSKQLGPQLEAIMEVPAANLPLTDADIKFDCDEISSHFPTFRLRSDRMEEYFDRVTKCSQDRFIRETLPDSGDASFRAIYDKMVRRYMTEFYEYLPTTHRENKASELNHRLSMSAISITHLLALKDQWANALSECKSGFIPESLVTPDQLKSSLDRLEAILLQKPTSDHHSSPSYKLTLPHSTTHMSRYYKSSLLADCAMTETSLVIRILVPLTQKRVTPSNLIRLKSVAFHTSGDEHQLCTVTGFDEGSFSGGRYYNLGMSRSAGGVVSSLAVELEHCDPGHFKLCRIPPSLTDVVDADTECARAIITHEFEASDENRMGVVGACKLKCERLDVNKFPVVVRAKDSLGTIYVLMNADQGESVFLECDKKDESLTLKAPPTGVLAIVLPCKCKLIFKMRTILPDPATCTAHYYVANAVPFHWQGQNGLA